VILDFSATLKYDKCPKQMRVGVRKNRKEEEEMRMRERGSGLEPSRYARL